MKKRVLDLFSGIGGFSLGLERAGMQTVAFVENEPYCRAVLQKHWPDVVKYKDVRGFDGRFWRGPVEIVCGGFPCQPWSDAGVKRGVEDDRDLWPEMARIIEESQPEWVIGENVSGFVNQPMGLDRSISDLEGLGYTVQTFGIPACSTGAPHRRMRAWIVAHASQPGLSPPEQETILGEGRRQEGRTTPECDWRLPQPEFRGMADGLPKGLDEAMNPWADGEWADTPRVATGVKDRVSRLRALGNAVVPAVVEKIGQAILYAEADHG